MDRETLKKAIEIDYAIDELEHSVTVLTKAKERLQTDTREYLIEALDLIDEKEISKLLEKQINKMKNEKEALEQELEKL